MLGIGAAWFALLHGLTAYIGLFKSANPLDLPSAYLEAFLVGAIALIILIALAATSFDKAMKTMKGWWFRLHRLVYVAGLLILLHVFMIGVHASSTIVVLLLSAACGLLVFAHSYIILFKKPDPTRLQTLSAIIALLVFFSLAAYGFTNRQTLAAPATS